MKKKYTVVLVKHASIMIKYMIFPWILSALAQVVLETISIDKTILLNLSAETIVYMSNTLMGNLGNAFRNCLKRGGGGGEEAK